MKSAHRSSFFATLAILALAIAGQTHAGPPFITDDPEPVELHHWEFYLATQQYHNGDGWSGTLPHIELNYGLLPDVQIHLIAPLAYEKPSGEHWHQGYGDTELGVKYRFVHTGEEGSEFMVGTFPLVELPTGNSDLGLGNGKTQVFVPVWVQKEFGKWMTYGGGGYWFNPGEGNRDYWFAGWEVQRKLTDKITAGLEIQFRTADAVDAVRSWALNAGGIWDFSDKYHLLFSAGHTVSGRSEFQGYLALQITWGPEDEKSATKK